MKQIEQTLSSIEVAEMVRKQHKNLLADVRGYVKELGELKIQPTDFFKESTYKTEQNKTMPCYNVTKKGCEFIAHKLTGVKGTEFTAKYINRFHDMEEVIREGIPEKKKQSDKKKKNLSSANMLVKTVSGIFEKAGVDPVFIAAEAKRLYKEQADIDIQIPLITDKREMPKLYDCTTIAKGLGILSESGRPHDKAVSAIIQKIPVSEEEIVKTAYSRNGHDGVTVQYKDSVMEKVKDWLLDNGYPAVIEYRLSNGNVNKCKVVYQEVA